MSKTRTNGAASRRAQWLTLLLLGSLVAVGGGVSAAGGAATAPPTVPSVADLPGEGTAESPYEISNASELSAMRQDMGAHYALVSDVDASGTESWNDGLGFETVGERVDVGDAGKGFTGAFDGRNHTISNLTVGAGAAGGLFFYVNDEGVVENLRLVNVEVSGSGGPVANALDGTVRNVVATGSVSGSGWTGGLVGKLRTGSVIRSGADVRAEGGDAAGGIAGMITEGTIVQSYAIGSVSTRSSGGGLVGSERIPGPSRISDSYARVDVDAAEAGGGIVGYAMYDFRSRSVYTAGSASGEEAAGGYGGSVYARDHLPRNAYWATDRAGVSDAYGYTDHSIERPTGRPAAEMTGPSARSSMSGLAFGDTWIATDGLPILAWQVENVTLAAPDRVRTDESPSVTVRLHLRRGETVTATTTAAYEVNDSAVSVDGGTLSASDNGTVAVTASVGDHAATETVEVLRPADVSIASASLPYERVGPDLGGRVNVTLTNDGGPTDAHRLAVRSNGSTVRTETVSAPGYASRTVTLDWNVSATGRYDVAVGNVSAGTLAVVAPPETSIADASVSADRVGTGEAVTVTATVENAGDAATTRTLALDAGGSTAASKTVVVPSAGRSVSFEWRSSDGGDYDLAVAGTDAGTVTVVDGTAASGDPASADSTAEPNAGDASEDGTAGASGPGFGPAVALVALVAAALYAARRRPN